MNIGIVTTWFDRGGAMVSRAYRSALSKAHEVYVFARGGEAAEGDPQWDDECVTWSRRQPRWTETAIAWHELRDWCETRQLDAILFNEQSHWPAVVLARRHLDAMLLAYVDYYTAETVPFFDLYDALLCNTRRHHGVFASHPKALYIPWGTDLDLFPARTAGAQGEGVRFFHSAGMSPERKGTRIALEAFKGLQGSCRMLLHMQVPLASKPEIASLCRSDARIEVVEGTVPPPGLYHQGDVYVYPSLLEGIGLTVPEALVSGLPVITVDAPPLNEFVRHGENGRLVRPHEFRGRADGYYWAEHYCRAEDVRAAMQYYLDHERDLPAEQERTQKDARQALDWSSNAKGLAETLENLHRDRTRTGLRTLEEKALRYAQPDSYWQRALRIVFDRLRVRSSPALDRLVYG